jgi:hypothetical protein
VTIEYRLIDGNGRLYQTPHLHELLLSGRESIKRFIVVKSIGANISIDTDQEHRHIADGVMFADGLIVTFSYINGFVGETKIYRSQRHLEHAYTRDSIHWLDGKPEVTDG